MISSYLIMVGRIGLGLVFLSSIVNKTLDWTTYMNNIRAYRIIPENRIKLSAYMIVSIEMIATIGISFGMLLPLTSVLALIILLCFVIAFITPQAIWCGNWTQIGCCVNNSCTCSYSLCLCYHYLKRTCYDDFKGLVYTEYKCAGDKTCMA